MARLAYALTEDQFLYAVVFDEDLAHEIAEDYSFDIREIDDFIEYDQGGTVN